MTINDPESNDVLKNPDAPAILMASREVKNTATSFKAEDWAKVNEDIKKASPEEQIMAETGIRFLQAVRDVDSPNATLNRAARQLPEIAKAVKVLEQHSSPDMAHVMKRLVDAASHFASPELQQEAATVFGAMTPDELEAARERASKMNVR
ncbi:MAG: hypothetical protein Q7R90_01490 [bacterium]|nr:hypothetical protein [bacterium]